MMLRCNAEGEYSNARRSHGRSGWDVTHVGCGEGATQLPTCCQTRFVAASPNPYQGRSSLDQPVGFHYILGVSSREHFP